MSAAPRAVRRVFDRAPNGQPKPPTWGPWHVQHPASTDRARYTLCGQPYGSGRPVEERSTTPIPAGALCARCWDRHEGRRKPGQFHPGIADAGHPDRPSPSTPRRPQ